MQLIAQLFLDFFAKLLSECTWKVGFQIAFEDPSKLNGFVALPQSVASAQKCAQTCFDYELCRSAGYVPNTKKCYWSPTPKTCVGSGDALKAYDLRNPVVIFCISCLNGLVIDEQPNEQIFEEDQVFAKKNVYS